LADFYGFYDSLYSRNNTYFEIRTGWDFRPISNTDEIWTPDCVLPESELGLTEIYPLSRFPTHMCPTDTLSIVTCEYNLSSIGQRNPIHLNKKIKGEK
jgi:hypothetical protein